MIFRKLFLITLLPVALVLQSCGPQDVVNPVTPPSTHEGGGDDGDPPTPPPTPGGETVSMTVCSFNIRYANTSDKYPDGSSAAWKDRAAAVKKFFDTVKPDLVGLQEIRPEQSKWFAEQLAADYGYYDVSRDSGSGASVSAHGGSHEGVGILYRKDRFELLLNDFFWLDEKPRELPAQNAEDGTYGAWHSKCRRVTVYAKLKDKKNDAVVWFFPTHYDHVSDEARKKAAELNLAQIKAICKVDDVKNANVEILHVGDLNTTYESGALKPLIDNMFYARHAAAGNDQYTGTYNGFGDKSSIIDHIFYGGKAVKPVKYWVDRTDYGVPFLSDHYPILFQWEYQ